MYCFNCGVKVIEGACFCQGCGQKFSGSDITEHDFDARRTAEATPREEFPQSYPAQIPEFMPMPEIAAIPDINRIPDAEIIPTPEQMPNPIPEPFPETLPDSFTDPARTENVSVTGITKGEINSYRYDANRSFTFSDSDNNAEINANENNSGNKETKKEKTYFGKAAFIFCLIIITALSVLCGIFAGLYIKSSEKKNRAGAFTGIINEIFDYTDEYTMYN